MGMLVTTIVLVAVVWMHAPYHDSLPSRCQLGLQIAVLCTKQTLHYRLTSEKLSSSY